MGRVEVVAEEVWDEDEDEDETQMRVEMQVWDDVRGGGIQHLDPLYVDGSRIWVCFENAPTQGWDFGISGSSPIQLSNGFPDRPHLEFIDGTMESPPGLSRIIDPITGKMVFQLPRRYSSYFVVQWDCQYLVAGYRTGEVLILDLHHVLPQ